MKKRSILEHLKDKSGAALMTVLVIFLVVVVIITSATMMASSNFNRAQKTANYSSAFYVAEAGLNETYEQFEAYFEENSNKTSYNQSFANDFIESIGGDTTTGTKTTVYDEMIMNEQPISKVSMEYVGNFSDGDKFKIVSTGYLGDDSRTVAKEIILVKNERGVVYQPDAHLFLDFDSPDDDLDIRKISSYNGPLITNKPLVFSEFTWLIFPITATLSGPFVSSNSITFEARVNTTPSGANAQNAIFISSADINVKSQNNLYAIVLKGDGQIVTNMSANSYTSTVKYLLVPEGKTESSVIRNVRGTFKADNIIYYNPKNFDPYDDKYKHIFGQEPQKSSDVDYRKYFEDNFILDRVLDIDKDAELSNTEKKAKKEKVLPEVVLPERPNYSSTQNLTLNYSRTSSYDFGNAATAGPDGKYYLALNSLTLTGGNGGLFAMNRNGIKLNVGTRDVVIVTKKFFFTGIVEIIGTGSLTIYVVGDGTNPITSNDLNLNPLGVYTRNTTNGTYTNDYSKLQLVVYETTDGRGGGLTYQSASRYFLLGSTYTSYLSVYSENLNLSDSSSSLNMNQFAGVFVTARGSFVSFSGFRGSSSQLIFAPKATIQIMAAKDFSGVLIGKQYNISNLLSLVDIEFSSDFKETFVSEIIPGLIHPGAESGANEGSIKPGATVEVD